MIVDAIKGPHGQARYVPVPETDAKPDWAATVTAWVVTAPGHSPAWDQFFLGVISLRPLPGVAPARKHYAEAEHEFLVMALNPDYRVDLAAREIPVPFHFLSPANVCFHFHGLAEEAIRAVVRQLVERTVQGQTYLETQGIIGAQETWKQAFRDAGATVP